MATDKKLPIVLVHGMWGTPEQFKNWEKFFQSAGYEVLKLRLPGHTRQGHVDGLSIHDYADYVNGQIEGFIGPCTLIGHSMGGLIARLVASKSDVVKQVVVVAGAPSNGICAITPEIFFRMLQPRYLIALLTGKGYRIYDHDARALMMNCMQSADSNPVEIFPSMESGVTTRELAFSRITIGVVKQPMLVIGGVEDKMTPPSVQEAVCLQHNAEIIWHGGGHMPMLEWNWFEVAGTILGWIKKLE